MTVSESYYNEYLRIANRLEWIEKYGLRDDELDRKIGNVSFKKKKTSSVLGRWALIGLGIMVPIAGFAWLVATFIMVGLQWSIFGYKAPITIGYRLIRDGVSIGAFLLVFVIGYGLILLFAYLFTKDHNEKGPNKVRIEKELMMKEKITNKKEALRLYSYIREKIHENIPQEYRTSEDIRRIANNFIKYNLVNIKDAVAYYERDLKNGVYE